MSLLSSIPVIGSILSKLLDRALPDKQETRAAQVELNKQELSGASPSRLRLWRSFVGWILGIVLAWEIIVRPLVLTYFPNAKLPPSALGDIAPMLLSMLGLGF